MEKKETKNKTFVVQQNLTFIICVAKKFTFLFECTYIFFQAKKSIPYLLE